MTIHTSPFDPVSLRDDTITQVVFDGLENRLGDNVLICGETGQTLTGQDFIDRVQKLAGGLTNAGFGAGKTVALMAPNIPEFCVVFHAVAWAGGTVTTLNPTYTASEVAHQINASNADLLITVEGLTDVAAEGAGGVPVVAIGTSAYAELFGAPMTAQVPIDIDDHILVLPFSSGTTGLPKGVMLSHRNLVANVDQTLASAGFKAGEVAAAFLPFFHIYGMTVLMNLHLAAGGSLVTLPRFDLELFLKINQDHKCRRMWIVPPVALALAKHPAVDNFDLSSVEEAFVGAAPLGAELSDAMATRVGCTVVQGYGMTELSPVSHIVPASAPRAGSAGFAASNTTFKIANPETGEPQPNGVEGEVWVKGPQVMKGYLNNAQATAETLTKNGWLRTGDIGKVDEDGYMFIVDRLKELIKFKGFQVAPAELEDVLNGMAGVTDAAVIGLPDPEAGEVPIAFVIRSDDGPTEDVINAHFKSTLASYKQLHPINFVDEIPKSASGKILRRLLRDQVAEA